MSIWDYTALFKRWTLKNEVINSIYSKQATLYIGDKQCYKMCMTLISVLFILHLGCYNIYMVQFELIIIEYMRRYHLNFQMQIFICSVLECVDLVYHPQLH